MHKASETDQLVLVGIIRRSQRELLFTNTPGMKVDFKGFVSPCWYLLDKPSNTSEGRTKRFILRIRSFILAGFNRPSMLLPIRWIGLEISVGSNVLNSNTDLVDLFKTFQKSEIYLSRQIGFYGYRLPKLDLSLEYDLYRNLSAFNLILCSGYVKSNGERIHSNSRPKGIIGSAFIENSPEFFSRTLFPSILESPSKVQLRSGVTCESAIHGSLSELGGTNLEKLLGNSRWEYKILENSEVLHGQIVYQKGNFILSDPSRRASWGSEMNLIPGLIFQQADGRWATAGGLDVYPTVSEGIFLGGTNNLMHTVLEDLPRLLLSNLMKIPSSIPIIVSSQLSASIMGLISHISKRQIIQLPLYTRINVMSLHFFQFKSPLPEVMNGVAGLENELFSRNLALSLRELLPVLDSHLGEGRRILILREPNLFRPITNIRKIQVELESRFKFESHYLGKMPFVEVQKLFQEASVIVGEYGAGLANVIHMPRGGMVIEIRGPLESRATEYEILVKALEISHSVIVGKARLISKYGLVRGPYSVSRRKLAKAIQESLRSFS